MWNVISIGLLGLEVFLLACFALGKFRNKKLNENVLFLGVVFLINVSLYLIPYLHGIIVGGDTGNRIFELMDLMERSVSLFLGNMSTGDVAEFTLEYPVYTMTYLMGAVLALCASVSATLEAFRNTIRNSLRLRKCLNAPVCDIVVGTGEMALHYAKKQPGSVLLVGSGMEKSAVNALMEEGHVVLRKDLTEQLLSGKLLNATTRYNIICPEEKDASLSYIDTFIAYYQGGNRKNIHLYVELDKGKTEAVRKEILEHSGCEELVTTFCSNELLARTFAEENPVTRYMPADFVAEDASMDPETKIHVFLLGFSELSSEIYRQMVLNNQLVQFVDGEYRNYPVHYHVYDENAKADSWILGGMGKALESLKARSSAYFPLPQMPYVTTVSHKDPYYRDTLGEMVALARQERSYSFFIVDTGDIHRNMETGIRLQAMLSGHTGHHLFVRSDAGYIHNSETVTYYGDFTKVFTHDVIVNDSISRMAKTLNEVYTAKDMQGNCDDAAVKEAAQKSWNAMDYFTLYSNIHCAANLRVKLNMLGLDYSRTQGEGSAKLLSQRYPMGGEYCWQDYFTRSRRNALLAQEHARWNAYHLMAEFLPMEAGAITVRSAEGNKVRFNNKNLGAKLHACLTTFRGLERMSNHLAATAATITGNECKPETFDYYVYDEMLITSADQLMAELGYEIVQR